MVQRCPEWSKVVQSGPQRSKEVQKSLEKAICGTAVNISVIGALSQEKHIKSFKGKILEIGQNFMRFM